MDLLPSILIGYLVGSLPIGYLITHGARGIDLRTVGSGNVGAANVYRTSGLLMAVGVMLVDAGKGAGAALLGGGSATSLGASGAPDVAAGVAAVVGHIYPVWLRFRGGKGVATASGAFGVLSPVATAIAAAAFALTVYRSRFVSLGSIAAALALPIAEWLMPGRRALDIGAAIAAALILFRHRGNIARLRSRTERALGT